MVKCKCGIEFEFRHNKKYCSIKCQQHYVHKKYYKGNFIGTKSICKRCGKEFNRSGTRQIYCSMNCNHGTYYTRHIAKSSVDRICKYCGKEFNTKVWNKKYCSIKCQTKHYSINIWNKKRENIPIEKRTNITINCKYCGKEFVKKSWNKFLCSKKCASKYNYYKNHEKSKEKNREWHHNNLDKLREYDSKRYKNINIKLHKRISNDIRRAFNKRKPAYRKHTSCVNIVGYTIDELKKHLEKQFKEDMNWDNYGIIWNIDHSTPIDFFPDAKDYNDPIIKKIWSLENLTPVYCKENFSKGNRYAIINGKKVTKEEFRKTYLNLER